MKQAYPPRDDFPISANAEHERIRAAYARRTTHDNRYSYFNRAYLFMIQDRERHLLRILQNRGFTSLVTKKILEIGCGTGFWLREFVKWGAEPENITGIDLLEDRVARANQLCAPAIKIRSGSAAKLEFPDSSFDLVLQSTVFTSILDAALKQQIASELLRVVTRDGLIIWYDYHLNNPNNPDVRGVKREEIHRLFPDSRIKLQRITLAPPLARAIVPHSWLLAHLLGSIPFLCSHYLGVIQKRE